MLDEIEPLSFRSTHLSERTNHNKNLRATAGLSLHGTRSCRSLISGRAQAILTNQDRQAGSRVTMTS